MFNLDDNADNWLQHKMDMNKMPVLWKMMSDTNPKGLISYILTYLLLVMHLFSRFIFTQSFSKELIRNPRFRFDGLS